MFQQAEKEQQDAEVMLEPKWHILLQLKQPNLNIFSSRQTNSRCSQTGSYHVFGGERVPFILKVQESQSTTKLNHHGE